MLTRCLDCRGFIPDDCSACPHCGAVADASAAAQSGGRAVSPGVRLLRRALKGTLIAGSSMVLAACYGCPPDSCGSLDDDNYGGSGGGGTDTGGTSTGAATSTGGALPTGGSDNGPSMAGEGGLGGLGGGAGFGGAAAP